VMTRDVEACGPEADLASAAAIMWRRDCGAAPVVDGDGRVVGMITDRDICMALATRGQPATEVKVGEVMSHPVQACTTVDDVKEALEVMRRDQLRRLPVVDSAGRLAGILSLSDVVLHSERGKSKKHVSHRDAMLTLKAICRPHGAPPHEEEQDTQDDAQNSEAANSEW
jgi:CBS domain-containing protein